MKRRQDKATQNTVNQRIKTIIGGFFQGVKKATEFAMIKLLFNTFFLLSCIKQKLLNSFEIQEFT